MNRKDGFDRLDFDNNFVFHKKIDTVTEWDCDVFVDDWKWFLGFEREPQACQLVTHARVVRLFEQSWTESRMDLVCRAKNPVGDVAMYKFGSVISVRDRVLRGEL